MKIRYALVSALVVFCMGSLLHFLWEWSGQSAFVAVFAAINESTWEHLKLAFWPALAITPVQRLVYGQRTGWLVATALRCTVPSALIVLLFYGYTALLGHNLLALDLLVFAIAILGGELAGYAILARRFALATQALSLGVLLIVTVLFATLSFHPPDIFLFQDPHAHTQ